VKCQTVRPRECGASWCPVWVRISVVMAEIVGGRGVAARCRTS
jgi:hypothetical protein